MSEILIAIVGGGVVGCSVAWELSKRYQNIFLFEKNPGITRGENQSSRNSGVIHSGIYYDQKTRQEKATLCVEGNRLLYDFCARYKVPALKTGKLVVATNGEEEETLDGYLNQAGENRVPGVRKISASKAERLAPNVKVRSALLVPTAGILEPTSLVYRLHTLASERGVRFMTGTEVVRLEKDGDANRLAFCYPDGKIDYARAEVIINAAGIDADLLARLLNPESPYELDPVRGESYKFYGHKRPELESGGICIYPTPELVMTPYGRHFTVGVHLTPTFNSLSFPPDLGSTVIVGPRLISVDDRKAWSGPPAPARIFAHKTHSFFPGLREEDLIWHQAGLQARLKRCPDFVIKADSSCPNFINLLGIDSPGLTSCLSIARRVGHLVNGLGLTRRL